LSPYVAIFPFELVLSDQSETPVAKIAILQVGLSLCYETMSSHTNGVCGSPVTGIKKYSKNGNDSAVKTATMLQ
jgi:hypothetical protein